MPWRLAFGALGAVGLALLGFVVSLNIHLTPADNQTGAAADQPRLAAARNFTQLVAGESATATVQLREVRFADWAAARAAVDFGLKQPSWTPEGFWLSALQTFLPAAEGVAVTPQSVVATFSGPHGSEAYYWIDQFAIARPQEFDLASTLPVAGADIPHGVIDVAGTHALWSGATMTLDAAGRQLGWDRSVTVLTWTDGRVGYRLEGKGVTLAELVRVAESLR